MKRVCTFFFPLRRCTTFCDTDFPRCHVPVSFACVYEALCSTVFFPPTGTILFVVFCSLTEVKLMQFIFCLKFQSTQE